eukprot:4957410-Karenia_brevis.AAC.1
MTGIILASLGNDGHHVGTIWTDMESPRYHVHKSVKVEVLQDVFIAPNAEAFLQRWQPSADSAIKA